MSEIICSYKINNQPEQSYFLMERNASYQQFIQFLHSSSIIDQSYSIYHLNNLIDSEGSFNTMLNSIQSTNNINIEFIFKNNQPETSEVFVEKPAQEAQFGETMKAIGEKIGVQLDKMPERPRELIETIPFPHKCVIRQFIQRIRQNENEKEAIIQQAANFYGVDASLLLKDVQEAIQYYKERRANKKSCKKMPKQSEIKQNQLFGENIQKILNEFHLDFSNIKSVEDIDQLIAQLAQPIANLVNIKLTRVAENPNKLKWISKRMARRFNVPEDKLLEEANHLVKQYIDSKKEVNDKKNENSQTQCKKRVEFHPARCDSCKSRIQGIRYWCLNCRNYDLCSTCEEKNVQENFHDGNHIFAKIKDARTMYRVFPGQGIRGKVHMMDKKVMKGPVEDRLVCLEETVKLLTIKLNNLQNK
ncbi:MAG: ZZ-type zinc finger protein [Bacteroidota bacterium]